MTAQKRPGLRTLVLPLAVGIGVSIAPTSRAGCRDIETLKTAAETHFTELCEAAESGNSGAMYWLGLAYIEGQVLNDYDRGLAWLKKAAHLGNEEAERLYSFIDSAQIGPGC